MTNKSMPSTTITCKEVTVFIHTGCYVPVLKVLRSTTNFPFDLIFAGYNNLVAAPSISSRTGFRFITIAT